MAAIPLKTPYPWFGGKATVADVVWKRFGNAACYVEPFFGGGAVLLNRPQPFSGVETVNDINAWLTNFWRAVQADPDAVAHHADWPVSELDLHARGDWLFHRRRVDEWVEKVRADPDFYDAKSAGWWVWGQCSWIGAGWGPRQLPHLGTAGRGVNRKRPHLGNAGRGVNRQLPHLGNAGRGVNRKRPHLGNAGTGDLYDYIRALSERFRRVRVCCGDWSRVCGPSATFKHGITAVFMDPPYGIQGRDDCYDSRDDREVSAKVREWCLEMGTRRDMRMALCGYAGEHDMPASWECFEWKAKGGYSNQGKSERSKTNRGLERIWFSPHCAREKTLFDEFENGGSGFDGD